MDVKALMVPVAVLCVTAAGWWMRASGKADNKQRPLPEASDSDSVAASAVAGEGQEPQERRETVHLTAKEKKSEEPSGCAGAEDSVQVLGSARSGCQEHTPDVSVATSALQSQACQAEMGQEDADEVKDEVCADLPVEMGSGAVLVGGEDVVDQVTSAGAAEMQCALTESEEAPQPEEVQRNDCEAPPECAVDKEIQAIHEEEENDQARDQPDEQPTSINSVAADEPAAETILEPVVEASEPNALAVDGSTTQEAQVSEADAQDAMMCEDESPAVEIGGQFSTETTTDASTDEVQNQPGAKLEVRFMTDRNSDSAFSVDMSFDGTSTAPGTDDTASSVHELDELVLTPTFRPSEPELVAMFRHRVRERVKLHRHFGKFNEEVLVKVKHHKLAIKSGMFKRQSTVLALRDVTEVLIGKQTEVFQDSNAARLEETVCFSLVTRGGETYDFEAPTELERDMLVAGFLRFLDSYRNPQRRFTLSSNASLVTVSSDGYEDRELVLAEGAQSGQSVPSF